jgi:hypothetical protein
MKREKGKKTRESKTIGSAGRVNLSISQSLGRESEAIKN